MLSKVQLDEAFMHYFEKMSSASGVSPPYLYRGSAPGRHLGTSTLQTPSLPTPGKNPAGPMFQQHIQRYENSNNTNQQVHREQSDNSKVASTHDCVVWTKKAEDRKLFMWVFSRPFPFFFLLCPPYPTFLSSLFVPFRQATQPGHCLHHLLPPKTSTYSSYQLCKRQYQYLLPTVQYSQFKNSYINRCLFNYTVFQKKWRQNSNHYNYGISYQN